MLVSRVEEKTHGRTTKKISSVILYFFNIRMECEKKFDGIFYSATGLNTPTPSQPHTVCIYYTLTQGKGESLTREKVRGATVHKAGSKIPL